MTSSAPTVPLDPSIQSTPDPGLAAIEFVFRKMNVDEDWSVREPRGFTWWGKDFAQRVWADEPFEEDGILVSRLHARADLVTGFNSSPENLSKLATLNGLASLSGLCVDASRVQFAASTYIHEQNRDWVEPLFLHAVAIQAANAQMKAGILAEMTGSLPAESAHPRSGVRPSMDEMLDVISHIYCPSGQRPSAWSGSDFQQAAELIRHHGFRRVSCSDQHVQGLIPLNGGNALVRGTSLERHPQLGNGLFLQLQLPWRLEPDEEAERVAALNAAELSSLTRAHYLGGWCAGKSGINFVCFLPNLAYRPGILENLLIAYRNRVEWIRGLNGVFGKGFKS